MPIPNGLMTNPRGTSVYLGVFPLSRTLSRTIIESNLVSNTAEDRGRPTGSAVTEGNGNVRDKVGLFIPLKTPVQGYLIGHQQAPLTRGYINATPYRLDFY